MFNMEDIDSLENSLEDFNGFGDMSMVTATAADKHAFSPFRVEYGACTKLGPKTNQEDRFVMIPSLTVPLETGGEVPGYDNETNTYPIN